MRLKLCVLILFLALFYHQSYSQIDSADFNFYSVNPVALNTEDSLNYLESDFKQIYLEFDLEDMPDFAVLYVELSMSEEFAIVSRQNFTEQNFVEKSMLNDGHVIIYLGLHEIIETYKVSITIENTDGSLSSVIIKDLQSI